MSKDINALKNQLEQYATYAKGGKLNYLIQDFETYYKSIQKDMAFKDWYSNGPFRPYLNSFLNNLLDWNAANKQGQLGADEQQAFEEVLNSIQQEQNSALKKLIRTELMDICDTMKGDLESEAGKQNLDRVMGLAELYDRVLNAMDKKETKEAFNRGEAREFLKNVDHGVEGNFSKTLRAFYNMYSNAEDGAEKEKWKKLCDSYAIRPYVRAVRDKIKQENMPEDEKEKRREAEALQQDPNKFVKMSPEERNEIRRTAEVNKLDEKRIAELKKDLKGKEERAHWVHRYFVEKPEKLARKSAALNRQTEKDSGLFRTMHESLDKLRRTAGYRQMEQALAEGKAEALISNLNQAIIDTQNYVNYANNKTFLEKGILGRSRLKAAKNTLRELTGIRQAINEEMGFLQDVRKKKEDLELLENAKQEKAEVRPTRVAEVAAKMEVERKLLGMDGLIYKVNGKNPVVIRQKEVSGWVGVNTRQVNKAAGL